MSFLKTISYCYWNVKSSTIKQQKITQTNKQFSSLLGKILCAKFDQSELKFPKTSPELFLKNLKFVNNFLDHF